jgi:hypothetical protein
MRSQSSAPPDASAASPSRHWKGRPRDRPDSRTHGVDMYTGEGLAGALTGVDALVDAPSSEATDHDEAVAFFSQSTRNRLDAEREAGVQHHVLLTIVRRAQGRRGPRQVHRQRARRRRAAARAARRARPGAVEHLAGDAVSRLRRDGDDLDEARRQRDDRTIAHTAGSARRCRRRTRRGRHRTAAGPLRGSCRARAAGLVDVARRTRAARGTSIRLVPTWSGIVGLDMAGVVLLPGPGARIGPTTFDDWLAGETRSPTPRPSDLG